MISFAKNIRVKFENESLLTKTTCIFTSSKFGFTIFFMILYPFDKQEVYIKHLRLNKYLYFVVYSSYGLI